MTFRAIRILKEADVILAEDTRTSGPLLKHFEIDRKAYAHHQHNEHKATSEIIRFLKEGKNVALISDAGTPAISDPGFFLVREVLKENIDVECLPGATAFVPALLTTFDEAVSMRFSIAVAPALKPSRSIPALK